MSSKNNDSDKEQDGTSQVSIDFNTFETFYKTNPDLDNAEYYQQFPKVNTGTIRSWKARAKKKLETEPSQTPQTPQDQPDENEKVKHLRSELIQVLKDKTRFDESLLNGLDEESQLKVLKNASEKSNDDPNIRLMTPSGTGKKEIGLEQYLYIDEKSFMERGFGDVELNIPASVILDPTKAEELKKYK